MVLQCVSIPKTSAVLNTVVFHDCVSYGLSLVYKIFLFHIVKKPPDKTSLFE